MEYEDKAAILREGGQRGAELFVDMAFSLLNNPMVVEDENLYAGIAENFDLLPLTTRGNFLIGALYAMAKTDRPKSRAEENQEFGRALLLAMKEYKEKPPQ